MCLIKSSPLSALYHFSSIRGLTCGSAISRSGRRGDHGRTVASEASHGIDDRDCLRLRERAAGEEETVCVAAPLPSWNQLVQGSSLRQSSAAELFADGGRR